MTIAHRHAQAIKDNHYLEKLAESFPGDGHDCMEIDAAVFDLMADPTKKRALSMYETSIAEWFRHWGHCLPKDDWTLADIAHRYGIDLETTHD